ncbi:hypothetical protein OsI_21339 [Oryza sativa Indica Group]|uniref:Secreted protein n=1 Tax=Oryza sativa subsp. indica TaxID=39946 RepID=A2Y8F9_ORYSI|nr:hypothetical protein OsI_21339 [Oryza sativa Indica Group]
MEWRWPPAGLGGCRLGAVALAVGSVGRRDSGGDGSGTSGRRVGAAAPRRRREQDCGLLADSKSRSNVAVN